MLLTAAAMLTLTSCSTEDHEDILGNWVWGDVAQNPDPEPEPEPEPTEANPNIVEAGWVNVSDQFENLPEYLNVYKKDKTTDGDAAIAYIAVADAATAKFEVASDVAKNAKGDFVAEHVYTPTEFYNNNEKPTVVINGGLFFYSEGLYYSQSAVYKDGELKSPNQTYYSIDWANYWYPTSASSSRTKTATSAHSGPTTSGRASTICMMSRASVTLMSMTPTRQTPLTWR